MPSIQTGISLHVTHSIDNAYRLIDVLCCHLHTFDILSCMCFFMSWPLLMLSEQLVLTTIRQEPSEQQDPDLGSTMCARFTDRFDKSEFAQSGLTPHPICVCSPMCMWLCTSVKSSCLNPRPSRATTGALSTRYNSDCSSGLGVMNDDFDQLLHVHGRLGDHILAR